MNCKQCGYLLSENNSICPACGNEAIGTPGSEDQATPTVAQKIPLSETTTESQTHRSYPNSSSKKSNPFLKSLIFGVVGMAIGAAALFAIFLINGISSTGDAKIEGNGYDTPEEAAEAYLIALRDQDMDAMLSTFAIESYIENYDLNAMVERLQAYTPYMEVPFPNSIPYTKELNLEARRSSITHSISNQYQFFNELLKDFYYGQTIVLHDYPDLVDDMEEATEDYIFEDLEITGSMDPEDIIGLYEEERNQENIAKQAKVFGAKADEVANVVITFEADGEEYVFCPQLVEYDGRWYIQSLQGNVSFLIGLMVNQGGISLYPIEDTQGGV